MKSVNKIIALVLIAMIGFGCNKKLDVKPQQNITPEEITTGDDVKALLFGAYSLLQNPSAFGERFFLTSDLLANSGQLDFVGTFADYRDLGRKTQISSNAVSAGMWANSYTIIEIVNTVLDKISLVDEDERQKIEGEAKFIRGIVYFELVNYYGLPYSAGNITGNLAVPMVLDPVYEYVAADHNPSRASVDVVYKQVISDLTAAAATMEPFGSSGRADKYAAFAFLSRVYMNMANYGAAAAAADSVIEKGGFGLNVNYSGAFNNANNSSEDVFAIQQTSQSNSGTTNNGISTFYAAYSLEPPLISGRGDVQANAAYFGMFPAGDVRGEYGYEGSNIAGVEGLYTAKWMQFYKVIPVVRLSEMYLTRGEANFRLGSVTGPPPVNDINAVRERAGASTLAVVTSADTFIAERFRELGFEGDRLWSLKRTKKAVGLLAYDSPKLVLPIPLRETDVNKNLLQNPTY
ncbi:MAG TPA: RagB/SusD family nutrient uptake outer membrane protein [Flavitalea sp.]|nr:RagB/SusD family nutrient uptake outer membrane protein [Flavitalea sp.]